MSGVGWVVLAWHPGQLVPELVSMTLHELETDAEREVAADRSVARTMSRCTRYSVAEVVDIADAVHGGE